MPDDTHTLKVRRHATSLASCPGWNEWALPKLKALIIKTRDTILTDEALSAERTMQLREVFRALTKQFLTELHNEAKAAFDTSAAVVHTDTLDSTLPEPAVIAATLQALTFTPDTTVAPPPTKNEPPPPVNDVSAFNPFDGLPQPSRKPEPATKP